MKPKIDTEDILLDVDELNDAVLAAAANMGNDHPIGESSGTLHGMSGDRNSDADLTIAEELVNAGNEEADLEQRVSSLIGENKSTSAQSA